MKTRDMTVTALFSALICSLAPWSFTAGAVPVTLATFAVCLAAAVLGWKRAAIAVAVYLLVGAVGLPVFSNASGGLQKLVGPTGGYLIGYIPLAVCTGYAADRFGRLPAIVLGMLAGTAVLYAFGTAWFCLSLGKDLGYALGVCVLPFLPGDAVKIAAASALAVRLRAAVSKRLYSQEH